MERYRYHMKTKECLMFNVLMFKMFKCLMFNVLMFNV